MPLQLCDQGSGKGGGLDPSAPEVQLARARRVDGDHGGLRRCTFSNGGGTSGFLLPAAAGGPLPCMLQGVPYTFAVICVRVVRPAVGRCATARRHAEPRLLHFCVCVLVGAG